MNWEVLGAIGEVLGAAAVFVSLLYLGMQIKATRETSQKAVLQGVYGKFNDVRQWLIESPELAGLFLNGLEHPENLSREDLFRFLLLCESLFLSGEEQWLLLDKKVDDERMNNTMGYLATFVDTPGGKIFWSHQQSRNLTQGFRKSVEEHDYDRVERFDLSVRS